MSLINLLYDAVDTIKNITYIYYESENKINNLIDNFNQLDSSISAHYKNNFSDISNLVNQVNETYTWFTSASQNLDSLNKYTSILSGKNKKLWKWSDRYTELEKYLKNNEVDNSIKEKLRQDLSSKNYLKSTHKELYNDFLALLS